jgi:hypothetical protein
MRNALERFVEKIEKQSVFKPPPPPPENRAVIDIMMKSIEETERPQLTM